MARLTPTQRIWRGRIETGLHIAAPVLDLLLAASDRVSRILARRGHREPPPLSASRRPIASLGPGRPS